MTSRDLESAWNGSLPERREVVPTIEVREVIDVDVGGVSGSFLAGCSDGCSRFIKTIDNELGDTYLPFKEFVVAAVAGLIDAPVAPVDIVAIPEQLDMKRASGAPVLPGVASGSRDLGQAQLVYSLAFRDKDNNTRRHAKLIALCDWCGGTDHQWLTVGAGMEFHSHDHGGYLANFGPAGEDLWSARDHKFLPDDLSLEGLDEGSLRDVVEVLGGALRPQLIAILSTVPAQWCVTNRQLEVVGAFLEYRATRTADRLAALLP